MNEIPENKARWVASLNNGEIAVEGSGKFLELKTELSPWNKLVQYIINKRLRITSLKIQIDGQTYNLPSIKPKFESEVPTSYNYSRKVIAEVNGSKREVRDTDIVEKYIMIEAIYPKFRLQLWVDETNKKEAWTAIVPR